MTVAQKVIKYLAIAFALFLIITIISGIFSVIYALSGILGIKNENKISYTEMSITSFENKDITKLEIDIVNTNLTIKTGEILKVETNNSNIKFEQDNKKLQIKEKDYNWFIKNEIQELILYVPENLEFEKIELNAGAGKIDIENLNTKDLVFELGAGETKIKSLNVLEKCEIEGGAGEINILSGTINNLDFDMGVGKANLTTKIIGKNEINAGIGELNIVLIGNENDYKIKANEGLGSITINGAKVTDTNDYGNGKNVIKIDGGVGNIKIDIKEDKI